MELLNKSKAANNKYITGGSKIRDNQDHFKKWLSGEMVGPLSIEISPTYGCNHNCTHCGFQQFVPYNSQNYLLADERFKLFLKDFSELGGKEIFFAGNGEPLMNKYIDGWFKQGFKLGLSMTMSTNGIPFKKEKRIHSILPYSKWIRFSVNGGDEDTYSYVHQTKKEDFTTLIDALKKCVSFKKNNNLSAILQLQFVCHNQNYKSIEKMCELHQNVGTDQLIFRNVFLNKGDKSLHRHKDTISILDKIKDKEGVIIRWDTFEDTTDKLVWKKCSGINFRSNMDHNGNLIVCNRHLHQNENAIYGNIIEKEFKAIWNSNFRQKIFKKIEDQIDLPKCYLTCNPKYDNIYIEEFMGKHH